MKSVIFTGNIDYDSIAIFYATADVFVIATLEDNWSLVVPEAMACGLPVACSIFNGCHPELIIPNRNGVTFNPFVPEDIVKSLGSFHNVDLKRYGEQSRIIEHSYSPKNVALNIKKAITKYLS